MEIIDAHVHLRSAGDLLRLKDALGQAGIRQALVMGTPTLGQAWKRHGVENDELLQILQDETSLHPIIAADLRDPLGAIAEIEEILEQRMIAGVKIFPGYQPIAADEPRLFPLYRFLELRGIPLLVHTGDPFRPGAQIACCRPVLLDTVAALHPQLSMVLCHLGNPWLMEAAEVICKNHRVRGDLAGLFLSGSGPFRDEYLDWLRRSLREMFAFVGEIRDRFLFGSDWPVSDVKECRNFACSLGLDAQDREDLLAGNARRLFTVLAAQSLLK